VLLADTSAWVEYDRATGSTVDQRLTVLVSTDGPLAVTEPVIMEVAAGASNDERGSDLRRLLLRSHLLGLDVAADFDAAAVIYRRCRRAGVTPREMIDCMIVSVARRHGATLLAHDLDMDRVARVRRDRHGRRLAQDLTWAGIAGVLARSLSEAGGAEP
jgi:predicted nucleic acid-binding protein